MEYKLFYFDKEIIFFCFSRLRLSLFLLKFNGILTKCVGKIFRPNVNGKFGVFYRKKTTYWILSKSSPAEIKHLRAMMTFKELI